MFETHDGMWLMFKWQKSESEIIHDPETVSRVHGSFQLPVIDILRSFPPNYYTNWLLVCRSRWRDEKGWKTIVPYIYHVSSGTH